MIGLDTNVVSEAIVTAKNGGRGFPMPDSYIAAVVASRGFIVAFRKGRGTGGRSALERWFKRQVLQFPANSPNATAAHTHTSCRLAT